MTETSASDLKTIKGDKDRHNGHDSPLFMKI